MIANLRTKIRDGESRGGRTPLTSTPPLDSLAKLESRIGRTYKARVETARRHQLRGNYWNVALVLASLTTTIVSIVSLAAPEVYGARSAVLMVALGAVTLVVSVLVSSAQFQVNAEKFFRAYRGLQKLWARAHLASSTISDAEKRAQAASEIDSEYQEVLDDTGNHSPADFYRAFPAALRLKTAPQEAGQRDTVRLGEYVSRKVTVLASVAFTWFPIFLAIAMATLLIPAVVWFIGG